MNRPPRVPFGVVVLAIVLAAGASVAARMGPSVLMIYGGGLARPVFIEIRTVADLGTYADFWNGRSERVVPAQYAERPYFAVAMFWGTNQLNVSADDVTAERAHQHGRLYTATKDAGAAMVSGPYMQLDQAGRPLVRPVPTDTRDFKYGVWLNEGDLRLADKLGVPLRNTSIDTLFRAGGWPPSSAPRRVDVRTVGPVKSDAREGAGAPR